MSQHVADVAGFEIEAYAAELVRRRPPLVSLHRLGSGDRSFFTPDEAERLAAALVDAAAKARAER